MPITWTQERLAELVTRWQRGEQVGDIAKALHTSYSNVQAQARWLRRAGVPLDARKKRTTDPVIDVAALIRLAEETKPEARA